MPIYEYKCSECGNVYEKRQKFTDPPDLECPACRSASVYRLTSAPALVFKGSGWYINDYARAGKGNGTGADGAKTESGSGDKAASTKTESSASTGSSASTSSDSSKPAPAAKP